jgi:NAD(P)H-hydrate epimerase
VEWNVVLVFKGAHTIVAAPDGRVALSPFKTDALSKAGTGDVLAGLIVGLLAQGLKPFDAAQVGVYLHGLAGTLAAESEKSGRSVLAGDVADQIGAAFHAIEAG